MWHASDLQQEPLTNATTRVLTPLQYVLRQYLHCAVAEHEASVDAHHLRRVVPAQYVTETERALLIQGRHDLRQVVQVHEGLSAHKHEPVRVHSSRTHRADHWRKARVWQKQGGFFDQGERVGGQCGSEELGVRVQILHFFGHKEQVVDLHVLIVGQLQISLLSPRICHGVQLCKVSVEYYTDYYIDRSIVILSKTAFY